MSEFERDVRNELHDVRTDIHEVKVAVARIEENLNSHPHPDHETRIRALEKKVWLVAGGLAALSWLADRLPMLLG